MSARTTELTFSGRNDWEMRRAGIGLALIVMASWSVITARFVLHGPVTPERLAWSVMGETGSAGWVLDDLGRCQQERVPSRWTCSVLDSGGSGDVLYAVTMRGSSSCWDAVLTRESGEVMPARASGCVPLLSFAVFF